MALDCTESFKSLQLTRPPDGLNETKDWIRDEIIFLFSDWPQYWERGRALHFRLGMTISACAARVDVAGRQEVNRSRFCPGQCVLVL
ncbi:hypothetical protein RRG08_008591 [Elysia crispata]|uniref:Uncharacterized protein n=1 Tax=Elysia crispata TaxID=231223 RepID=A0AAE1EB03_9GAST|nr:hypothetical protein RRG08_008591 [Elysia crispata]